VLLSRWEHRGAGLQTKTTSTDVVLDADRAAEAAVVKILRTAYPRDAIVAEEGSGAGESSTGFRWFVDPLDGTVNYLYQLDNFSVSIAVEDADGALVGVVYNPINRKAYHAIRGAGVRMGVDPMGGAGVHYWARIAERLPRQPRVARAWM